MGTRGASVHAFATTLFVLTISACGASTGPVGTGGPSGDSATNPPPASTNGAVPGGWQGTITVQMVESVDETQTTESGDPGSLYHTRITAHDFVENDITDEFTVSGRDRDDVEYGVVEVDLTGLATNRGDTLQRHVSVEDKRNALGCHFLEEIGSKIDGSWTLGGDAHGEIRFSDDGTYRITIGGGDYGEDPLPRLGWQTYTILEGAARDCPPPGRSEVTGFGQYGQWAYRYIGENDIEGSLDAANPGSVVQGSLTFDIDSPKATITVTWHLVHEGPINLPHE